MAAIEEEQSRYLETALKVVREQAFYMKRAMDGDSLKLALDHATEMLRELRTNLLTPKNYYELYMKILDELRELEEYLSSLQRSGRSMVEIYEQVQTCANIVPRMYLLCCVGSVYITSKEAPAKDILKDLVEMIKGVQSPTRGLFLRNYLTQISKNKLPDVGSPYEGLGGTIQDAYSFLLQNFAETNRLWVRLQTQGAARDKKKREKERLDLRILVGTNLVRISQLEGLDINEYRTNVLPKVLEEVLGCKDTIAQSYLMDCIIQVFPDEYHLATLEPFLSTCASLKEKVNVRAILEALMDRLANHAAVSGGVSSGVSGQQQQLQGGEKNSFKLFNDCITTLIEERSNMSLTETLRLQTVLTNFALKCHPTRIDYVAHCLSVSGTLIEKTDFVATTAANAASGAMSGDQTLDDRSTNETTIQIEALLSSPLKTLALRVLEMPSYAKLMTYLPWGNWKEVASTLLKAVISNRSPLCDINQVEQLFKMISPLLRDRDGAAVSAGAVGVGEEGGGDRQLSAKFREEQGLVARLPHLMKGTEDTDVLLKIFVLARSSFTSGGAARIQFTFPPLIFAALGLARRVFERERAVALAAMAAERAKARADGSTLEDAGEEDESSAATAAEAGLFTEPVKPPQYSTRKVFHFVIEAITALATSHAEMAFKLFLQAAQATDECGYHAISYEFVKEALLIYEGEISDSKTQVNCLATAIGSLLNCRNFPTEDYEALITKIAQYANKLLKKPDQCRMVSLCSHLFWPRGGLSAALIADDATTAKSAGKAAGGAGAGGNTGSGDTNETYADCDRVLECMQRSLKIASVCNPNLFVEILDRYIYYFENGNPIIQVRYLSGLIALINEQISGGGAGGGPGSAGAGASGAGSEGQSSSMTPAAVAHYKNTIEYIRSRQAAAETKQKFAGIQL